MRNAPELRLGLEFYYLAYYELSSERPAGFGPQPIPWRAIRDWADAHGVEGEQLDDLFHHVRALDRAFLRYHDSSKGKK